ncbi:MAG: DNA repair protein RecO [Desulfovibrio sp.]|jgi:DNA repair protein RecO (recombination protein O)|nr:DNA repair protein RecO [Desulfovibrio sp.]
MDFSETVLVLQVGQFRESDLWVRFLSPSRGLLTAFAFGGSRSRRRFAGCLDIFNEVNVSVGSSLRVPYLALREGVLVRGLSRLRRDWRRFGVAVNCARFLQSFGVQPEGAAKAYFLLRETVSALEEPERPASRLLPLFFRARLSFDQGYALSLTRCFHCGRELSGVPCRLLTREGRVACCACAGFFQDNRLSLGPEALSALRHLHVLPPADWHGLALPPAAEREFSLAVDAFVRYHVGIFWKDGRFVRH